MNYKDTIQLIKETGFIAYERPIDHREPFAIIYKITNMIDGRIYVGKKQLQMAVKKKLSKKARRLPENKRKRILRTTVSGDFENYWGSCAELAKDIEKVGLHNFKKEILQYAYNRAQATYFELVWQITLRVLEVKSYNGWVKATVYKNKLINQNI